MRAFEPLFRASIRTKSNVYLGSFKTARRCCQMSTTLKPRVLAHHGDRAFLQAHRTLPPLLPLTDCTAARLRAILTVFLLCEVKGKGESHTEARIIARLDALRRNRGSEKELGQLIQEELDRTPVRERDKLLGYFERWLDRQCLTLLEEWTPKSRMVQ